MHKLKPFPGRPDVEMDVIQLAFSIPLGYIDMVNSMPQPEYNKIIDSMRQVLSDALAEYTEKSKENSKNG